MVLYMTKDGDFNKSVKAADDLVNSNRNGLKSSPYASDKPINMKTATTQLRSQATHIRGQNVMSGKSQRMQPLQFQARKSMSRNLGADFERNSIGSIGSQEKSTSLQRGRQYKGNSSLMESRSLAGVTSQASFLKHKSQMSIEMSIRQIYESQSQTSVLRDDLKNIKA